MNAVAETPQSDKVGSCLSTIHGRENLGELTVTHVPRTNGVPRRSKTIRTFCPKASAAELSCTIHTAFIPKEM